MHRRFGAGGEKLTRQSRLASTADKLPCGRVARSRGYRLQEQGQSVFARLGLIPKGGERRTVEFSTADLVASVQPERVLEFLFFERFLQRHGALLALLARRERFLVRERATHPPALVPPARALGFAHPRAEVLVRLDESLQIRIEPGRAVRFAAEPSHLERSAPAREGDRFATGRARSVMTGELARVSARERLGARLGAGRDAIRARGARGWQEGREGSLATRARRDRVGREGAMGCTVRDAVRMTRRVAPVLTAIEQGVTNSRAGKLARPGFVVVALGARHRAPVDSIVRPRGTTDPFELLAAAEAALHADGIALATFSGVTFALAAVQAAAEQDVVRLSTRAEQLFRGEAVGRVGFPVVDGGAPDPERPLPAMARLVQDHGARGTRTGVTRERTRVSAPFRARFRARFAARMGDSRRARLRVGKPAAEARVLFRDLRRRKRRDTIRAGPVTQEGSRIGTPSGAVVSSRGEELSPLGGRSDGRSGPFRDTLEVERVRTLCATPDLGRARNVVGADTAFGFTSRVRGRQAFHEGLVRGSGNRSRRSRSAGRGCSG